MKQYFKFISLILVYAGCIFGLKAQFQVDTLSYTAEELVKEVLVTGCMQAQNIEYTGDSRSIGKFDYTGTGFEFSSGIILSTGFAADASGPNNEMNISSATDGGTDADLSTIVAPNEVQDAAILEFDFIPSSDSIWFRFVFASDEYPEYVCSFNDVFGFFISGPGISGPYGNSAENIAVIPGTAIPVSIDNVNNGNPSDTIGCPPQNSSFYIDNGLGLTPNLNTELQYDGRTVAMVAYMSVIPCETYHIKLAIGDAIHDAYDSAVMLEAGSFSSGSILQVQHFGASGETDTVYEGCDNYFLFSRWNTEDLSEDLVFDISFSGTATQDDDYSGLFVPSLTIPAGETFITFPYTALLDGLTEGVEQIVYTIVTNDTCECDTNVITITDSLYILDNDTLIGGIQQNDTTICYPDVLTLTVGHSLMEDLVTYSWSTGESDSVIMVSPQTDTKYYVTITDICGQLIVDSVDVSVKSYAQFLGPETKEVCLGDSVVFNAIAFGTLPITLQWFGPDGIIPGETDDTLYIDTTKVYHDGDYYIVATNVCGDISSDTIALQVSVTPMVLNQPDSVVACEGDSVGIFVGLNTYGSYQWYYEGVSIQGATDSIYNIAQISFADTGHYYCEIMNSCSGLSSDSALVEVLEGTDLAFLPISDVCISSDAVAVNFAIPAGGVYSGIAVTDTVFDPAVSGAGVFSITYTYTNTLGCNDSISQTIEVIEPPVLLFDTAASFCSNAEPVVLDYALPIGGLYTLNYNDTITVFDPSLLNAGEYILTYHYSGNDGCVASIDDTVRIDTIPVVLVDSIIEFCVNVDSVLLFSGLPLGGVYSGITVNTDNYFFPQDAGEGFHMVDYSFTAQNQCSDSKQIAIRVGQTFTLDFDVTKASCNSLSDGAIDISPIGGIAPYEFLWLPDSIDTEDISGIPVGDYQVYASDSSGCHASVVIEVEADGYLDAFAGEDKTVCAGFGMVLSDSLLYDTLQLSYSWEPAEWLDDPDGMTPLAQPDSTKVFYLTVTDGICSAVDSMTLTVVQPIGLDLGEDVILLSGESYPFNIDNTFGYTFTWEPTDGLSSVGSVSTTFDAVTDPGRFQFTYYVTAESAEGCSEVDSINISVVDFVIPKGFTPNGDGVNDTWEISMLSQYSDVQLDIFNRWGKHLFSNVGFTEYWDGKANGIDVPEGTYYYIITVPEDFLEVRSFPISGSVTILR